MRIRKITETEIIFDNGNALSYYHEQDCCESVYADFENIQVLTKLGANCICSSELEFNEDLLNYIELQKDVGFTITDTHGIKLLVSCYNRQNGYYSSELSLVYKGKIKDRQFKTEMDISDCAKEEIY